MPGMPGEHLLFNGVDGATGAWLRPPVPIAQLARGARRLQVRRGPVPRRLRDDVDPRDLARTGWGVIWGPDATPEIRRALAKLLRHRQSQAARWNSRLYRETSYGRGESKEAFLRRHGVGPGPVDPAKLPYYLLIVGGPEVVPFSFQHQLAIQYAVGRLWLDRTEDYTAYAEGVLAAEREAAAAHREAVFFATCHPDDPATGQTSEALVRPLANRLKDRSADWSVRALEGEKATKERLASLLGGDETPALLFTAAHGLGFLNPDRRQPELQGALVCQEWPGPEAGAIREEHFLSGRDIPDDARLQGLVAFHFACYSAGTPPLDSFWHLSHEAPRKIADNAFLSGLSRRLLSHPRGGALAVIGHVDQVWLNSFLWEEAGPQIQTFEAALARLLDGVPVGAAAAVFGERYAEIAADLCARLEPLSPAAANGDLDLATLWLAHNDARSYAVLGDPAVRLPAGTGRPGEQSRDDTAPRVRGNGPEAGRHGASEVRYTDVTAPRRLTRGRRGVVTVRLTVEPPPDSETPGEVRVRARQKVEIHLHGDSCVEVLEEAVRTIAVPPDRDTEPALFFIRGIAPGTAHLVLDFRQHGVVIGSASLGLEILPEPCAEEQVRVPAETLLTADSYALPPDLDLRVVARVEGGTTVLRYVVHSPNGTAGFHFQAAGGLTLRATPEAYHADLLESIESKTADLVAIGRRLYDELFTSELKTIYRRLRGRFTTLQVTSDEPWIPWELVKPYDDEAGETIDDDFLGAGLQMTRWLAGRSGPAARIRVSRLACIVAGDLAGEVPLPSAGRERQYLTEELALAKGIEYQSPDPPTNAAVKALLDQGGVGLWHFCGHGDVDPQRPDGGVLVLAEGPLHPIDLHGIRKSHIAADRPLVFLNACRAGRQGWTLTRLGGWAAAWVDRCRCGAFVGPLWTVDDFPASEFACGFYRALEQGATIGQAVKAAQKRARAAAPDDPTWLAYAVYAHPNGFLTLVSPQTMETQS